MSANNTFGLYTLETSGAVSETYSPDQTKLYVAKDNGNVDVFDVVTHQKIATWDVGQTLGGVSVSEDGKFLLVTEQNVSGTLYKVNTSTGAVQTFTTVAGMFGDVEIVDANTALITGTGQFMGQVHKFDIATSTFSSVPGGVEYSDSSVIVQDGQYVLLAETGISNGPLFVYDTAARAFVASGDDYQSPASGFNWGIQAISAKAGIIAQYVGSINIYDLDVHYIKTVDIGEYVDGMVFNDAGTYAYIYLIESGAIAKFDTATWTKVEEFSVGTESWNNNIGYGDQLLVSHDEKYITVMDSSGVGKLQLIDLTLRDQTFYGTSGADTFEGGKGDDTYYVANAGDTLVELANEGTDRVLASVNYTLAANVENLVLQGSAVAGTGNTLDNVITGNGANNTLYGLGGNDQLDGGAGADTMSGGLGNDTYYVDNVGDRVGESDGGGIDRVISSLTWTLGNYLENLTLSGTAAIDGYGNGLDNKLVGNNADNILNGRTGVDSMYGGLGNDTYYVDNAGDYISEYSDGISGGIDTVISSVSRTLGNYQENLILSGADAINGYGNGLDNKLVGNNANNILSGGAGTDSMYGGLGNDTYYVDSASDYISESSDGINGGIDTVISSVSRTLGNYQEILILSGAAAIDGYGNGLDNKLGGNNADNILNGGAGADSMYGGLGNDTYYVDNTIDYVGESGDSINGGIDTVISSLIWTLGNYLENLTLSGTAAIDGYGNGLNNKLVGNSADNILNGGAGADSMYGGLGNDTYYVDSASDYISESSDSVNGGIDTVISTFTRILGNYQENLTLSGTAAINGYGNALDNQITGNSADNIIKGGEGNDSLSGGDGNDTLIGGLGKDTLVGGNGNDVFDFNALAEMGTTTTTWDVISGFARGQDRIDLATLDANMETTANDAFASLTVGGTFSGKFASAGDLYFDNVAHVLYGNTNADAAAEFAIQITGITTLSTADLVL